MSRITKVDLTIDKKTSQADFLTREEFTEEKFDWMVGEQLRQSNAESFRHSISELTFQDKPLSGEIVMTATAEGMQFEGVEEWLSQVYAILNPEQADEASAAAAKDVKAPDKMGKIYEVVKRTFWETLPRSIWDELFEEE